MTQQGVRRLLLTGTAAAASIAGAPAEAQTAGTGAGTQITNTATASYTVNGTPRSTTSNEAKFVVDRKVNIAVASGQSGNTMVTLGQTGAVTTFVVTNKTNGTQDIVLQADQNVGVGGGALDNFDVANAAVYADTNGNGRYDAGTDQAATYLDEVGPDQSRTVFIVADVPSDDSQTYASVSLKATVAGGGAAGAQGSVLTPTPLNTANQQNEVDIVFADDDSDGLVGADTLRNGAARAYLEYEMRVNSIAMAVAKSATVLSDGVSVANPKALPGATVQYCITITNNSSSTAADTVTLTDVVPQNTSYIAGSIRAGGLGTNGVCLLNAFAVNDDGSPTPLSPYSGSYDATARKVTASVPQLNAGGSFAVSFQVTVN